MSFDARKSQGEVELHEISESTSNSISNKENLNDIVHEVQPNRNSKTIEFTEELYYGDTRIAKDDPNAEDEDVVISMKNVHKTYLLGIEGVPALRGVSVTIKKGEFICVFGTSGGGKTTLLNIMGTIDKPTKGDLKICGTRISHNTKDIELSTIRLQKVGFVFQTFNLLSSLTALENVEMPMILSGTLSQTERRQRAKELLDMVGMTPRLNHIPSQLSGGEQQRVTIARAIANSPEILLLDEPTGDLDTLNSHIVMQLLTELNQKKRITMVMVTHDVGLKSFADRIIWMRDGKIQRIEEVSRDKKIDAIKRNEEELEALRQKKKREAHGTNTEYRLPKDYHTYSPNSRGKDSESDSEDDFESDEQTSPFSTRKEVVSEDPQLII